MHIEAYLDRIGYQGPRSATLETLRGVTNAHAMSAPWENLDVQLGKVLTTDVAAAYDKIVVQRRGGWCYENNGLFGWALEQLGFKVTRFCGGPSPADERFAGNHLSIKVELEGETWICDVGGGDLPAEPFRLVEGEIHSRHYVYRLEKLEDGWWRLHNHPLAILPFVDLNPDLTDEALLAERCAYLTAHPDSVFVQNAVAIAQWPGSQCSLRGRIFVEHDAAGVTKKVIEDADDYVRTLKDRFRLDAPWAAELWPKILARHEELYAAPAQ